MVAVGPPTSVMASVAEVNWLSAPVTVLSKTIPSLVIEPRDDNILNSISLLGIELI